MFLIYSYWSTIYIHINSLRFQMLWCGHRFRWFPLPSSDYFAGPAAQSVAQGTENLGNFYQFGGSLKKDMFYIFVCCHRSALCLMFAILFNNLSVTYAFLAFVCRTCDGKCCHDMFWRALCSCQVLAWACDSHSMSHFCNACFHRHCASSK